MMTFSPRARILAIRFVTLAFSVAVSVATLTTREAAAAPLNPPYDVYETGPLADTALDAFSSAPGPWVSIHQERVDGRTWLLLALPDGEVATPVPGADRPRYLGRVREGERVLLSAPPEKGEARLRTGRPISITPAGATVHVTSDRPSDLARETPHQFHVLERGSAPPPPRRDGPPPAMAEAIERAREVRPDVGGRSVADVLALIDAVRADSLESYIRALSEEASGQPSTRWWEDARTRGVVSDYVVGKFQEALAVAPGSSVFQHGFDVESDVNPGTTTRVYNIVGRLPAAVESRGAIMVTAHLDAIGVRSDPALLCALGYKDDDAACDCGNAANDDDCLWSGASDPAPGADDNSTGIAALLESIRILAPLEFDFDIYWVAFQAEELGLLGSAAFADSVVTGDQEIWAVLNMDMLGYNAERNQLDLVTDEGSQWFADWIKDSGSLFTPALPVNKYVELFGRSDHASFWASGIDAILLIEDKTVRYPGYHRVTDVWDTIFPASGRPEPERQLQYAVQLAVATLGRFAVHYDAPDLAMPEGEVTATPFSPTEGFVRGRSVTLRARVRNLGQSSLTYQGTTTDSLTARVRFFDGAPDAGGTFLGEVTRKDLFLAGGQNDFEWIWNTSEATLGYHTLWAEVEGLDPGYDVTQISADNDRSATTIFLKAASTEGPRILEHYVYPNPAPAGTALTFYYELTRNATVEMQLYDLEGTLVARLFAGGSFVGEGNRAGPNRAGSRAFQPDLDTIELESGVYLYSLQVGDGNSISDSVRGKFAIVR